MHTCTCSDIVNYFLFSTDENEMKIASVVDENEIDSNVDCLFCTDNNEKR